MSKLVFRLIVCVVIAGLIIGGAVVYVLRQSCDILMARVEKELGVPASAAEVTYLFPSTIRIRGLRVGKQLEADLLLITPSVVGFFQRKTVVFNEILILRPRVRLVRRPNKTVDVGLPSSGEPPAAEPAKLPAETPAEPPAPSPKEAEPTSAPAETKTDIPLPFYVEHLKITDGRVTFIDESLGEEPPLHVDVTDVQLETRRASLLDPFRIVMDCSAKVGEGEGIVPGQLTGSGQADLLRRTGTGRLDIAAAPMKMFEPYFFKYTKKKLLTGTATVSADFRGEGNDVSGDCRVVLGGMSFQEPEPAQGQGEEGMSWKDFGAAMLSSLFFSQGGITFDISFSTHLDKPRFENVKLKGALMPAGIMGMMKDPSLPQSGDDIKKIGKGFEAIGKEFKKKYGF